MKEYKKSVIVVTKFSLGLALLLLFSLLITSSHVSAQSSPLKNDFTFVWGTPDVDEDVYGMEFISNDIVYIAGNIDMTGIFLTKLNISKLRSGNPFPDWLFSWERTDARSYFGDMIVDSSENVYIVGTLYNLPGGNLDIFLMRFNSAGTLEWNITWGASGQQSTMGLVHYGINILPDGNCLIMDSATNVYVAGKDGGDAVLIKYNNFGIYQWNHTFNIYNKDFGEPCDDYCEDITIDSSNNIYLALIGDETFYNVLKLNSAGNIVWNTTFTDSFISEPIFNTHPPAKILIDTNGLFYYSGGYLTKFDLNTGLHLWNVTYVKCCYLPTLGPPIKMDFDSSGNLTLLTTDSLRKFNSQGTLLWNTTLVFFIEKDMNFDSEDYIYLLSRSESERRGILISNYNPHGELQYYYAWGSPENEWDDDYPSSIFVDSLDNIYVSGKTSGFGSEGDYNLFLAAFSRTGPSEPTIPFDLITAALITLSTIVVLFIGRKRKIS